MRLHAGGNEALPDVGPGETEQTHMFVRLVNWLGRLAGYCNDPGKRDWGLHWHSETGAREENVGEIQLLCQAWRSQS